jgi:hypothetical protein
MLSKRSYNTSSAVYISYAITFFKLDSLRVVVGCFLVLVLMNDKVEDSSQSAREFGQQKKVAIRIFGSSEMPTKTKTKISSILCSRGIELKCANYYIFFQIKNVLNII